MKMPVFAIRDQRSAEFLFPAPDANELCAKRSFQRAVCSGEGLIGFSPEDFDLYQVGSYDSTSAQFESCIPEFVCNGIDVLDMRKQNES